MLGLDLQAVAAAVVVVIDVAATHAVLLGGRVE
jgi:hypothetical protein